MYSVDVSVKGISSLLQNRHPFPEEEEEVLRTSGVQDYSQKYELAKYLTEDGRLCQPADHFIGCMKKAAVNYKIKGKRGKTFKDLVSAAVFIEPNKIIHKIQDCVKDRQWVRIQRAAVVRERPRFDSWELDFNISVVDDQLPPEMLKEILAHGGLSVGIGDYRPRYGRFEVTKFEVAA